DQSKCEARLAKAYPKDGRQFGVIDFDFKMAVKSLPGLPFDPPGRYDWKGSLDVAIDGSSSAATLTATIQLAGRAVLDQGRHQITLDFNLICNRTERASAEQ